MAKGNVFDIPDYPDYGITLNGEILSFKKGGQRKLKQSTNNTGYLGLNLCNNAICKPFLIHVLMATVFLGHKNNKKNMIVTHIDGNKENNKLTNLKIINIRDRDNISHINKTRGVCVVNKPSPYVAMIRINGKKKGLGSFKNIKDAENAYKQARKELDKVLN